MTTIDITEHLAQFTATGLIVVDGIEDNFPLGPDVPEPWRKLTDPCPDCRDSRKPGQLHRCWPGQSFYSWKPCTADCAGGRRVVTLTATCPRCQNDPPCEHKLESGSHGWGCTKCGLSGVGPLLWHRDGTKCENHAVTLGRFTVRLLPISDPYHPMPAGAPWLVSSPGGPCYLIDADGAARGANLPLDPQPGQWAVHFEQEPS